MTTLVTMHFKLSDWPTKSRFSIHPIPMWKHLPPFRAITSFKSKLNVYNVNVWSMEEFNGSDYSISLVRYEMLITNLALRATLVISRFIQKLAHRIIVEYIFNFLCLVEYSLFQNLCTACLTMIDAYPIWFTPSFWFFRFSSTERTSDIKTRCPLCWDGLPNGDFPAVFILSRQGSARADHYQSLELNQEKLRAWSYCLLGGECKLPEL